MSTAMHLLFLYGLFNNREVIKVRFHEVWVYAWPFSLVLLQQYCSFRVPDRVARDEADGILSFTSYKFCMSKFSSRIRLSFFFN